MGNVERIQVNYDIDKATGRTFIEAQVDSTMRVRVYSDFEMEVYDDNDGDIVRLSLPVDQFRRSFEALMKEFDERYGGRP